MKVEYSKEPFVIPLTERANAKQEFCNKVYDFLESDFLHMKVEFENISACNSHENFARGKFKNSNPALHICRRLNTLYFTKGE